MNVIECWAVSPQSVLSLAQGCPENIIILQNGGLTIETMLRYFYPTDCFTLLS